jgi:hypothetical protein
MIKLWRNLIKPSIKTFHKVTQEIPREAKKLFKTSRENIDYGKDTWRTEAKRNIENTAKHEIKLND